ncbi:hypothetical protein K1719_004132 [Acacia pycnantha]|nr:hypothetical protein K1719_004132 [Acacia pycnantha]
MERVQRVRIMGKEVIELAQGWKQLQEGITKLKNILEGLPNEKPFTSEAETIEEYLNSTVLPSLRDEYHEFLLRELVKRWSNHKVMTRWLSHFFHYVDRYYTSKGSVPKLNDVALTCF